jgi:hypothetical protein
MDPVLGNIRFDLLYTVAREELNEIGRFLKMHMHNLWLNVIQNLLAALSNGAVGSHSCSPRACQWRCKSIGWRATFQEGHRRNSCFFHI